ncbi:hypothetical protein D3C86_2222540 [compost metagenome]
MQLVALRLGDQRAELRVGGVGIAHLDRLELAGVGADEGVVVLLGHDEALGVDAGLPIVEQAPFDAGFHG